MRKAFVAVLKRFSAPQALFVSYRDAAEGMRVFGGTTKTRIFGGL